MRLEVKKHLDDIRRAAVAVQEFTRDATVDDYLNDAMLRSAVERQFGIMGEALNRLHRTAPGIAESIPHYKRVIAFRNILIHGYDVVEHRVVWDIIQQHLSPLHDTASALLQGEQSG